MSSVSYVEKLSHISHFSVSCTALVHNPGVFQGRTVPNIVRMYISMSVCYFSHWGPCNLVYQNDVFQL